MGDVVPIVYRCPVCGAIVDQEPIVGDQDAVICYGGERHVIFEGGFETVGELRAALLSVPEDARPRGQLARWPKAGPAPADPRSVKKP